jgi:uncharacterized membrane protein
MPENAAPPVDETATTSDERTMAVLAHVLQLVGGWIAPLIIFFSKRQSRFITFHALQVLLFEGVCIFLTMAAMTVLFLTMVLGITRGGSHPSILRLLPWPSLYSLGSSVSLSSCSGSSGSCSQSFTASKPAAESGPNILCSAG